MSEIDANRVLAATGTALAKDFLKALYSSVEKAIHKKYHRYFESFLHTWIGRFNHARA